MDEDAEKEIEDEVNKLMYNVFSPFKGSSEYSGKSYSGGYSDGLTMSMEDIIQDKVDEEFSSLALDNYPAAVSGISVNALPLFTTDTVNIMDFIEKQNFINKQNKLAEIKWGMDYGKVIVRQVEDFEWHGTCKVERNTGHRLERTMVKAEVVDYRGGKVWMVKRLDFIYSDFWQDIKRHFPDAAPHKMKNFLQHDYNNDTMYFRITDYELKRMEEEEKAEKLKIINSRPFRIKLRKRNEDKIEEGSGGKS